MANFWAWVTFSRMSPVLKLGKERSLTDEDLESLDTDIDVEALYSQFLETYSSTKSVPKTFYILFRRAFWLGLFFYSLSPVAQFFSPVLIGLAIDSMSGKSDAPELRWLWAVLLFVVQVTSILGTSTSDHILVRSSLRARTVMVTAVFRLSVTQHAHHCVKSDYVNLMSQDSQRLVEFAVISMRCVAAPLQVVAGTVYGYFVIGWPVFVGFALMLAVIPVTSLMGKKAYAMHREKMKASDYRITYVNEILQAMKVVKSNSWDEACLREIERRRKVELKHIFRFRILNAILVPFSISIPTLATVLVFVVKILFANQPDDRQFNAKNAFQIIAVFLNLRLPFVILPLGTSLGSQVLSSFKRLEAFLELESRASRTNQSVLSRQQGTYSWKKDPSKGDAEQTRAPFELQVPPFEAAPGSFVAIVGPVGGGKTAFLRAILGEMTGSSPSKETVGYCADMPFIRHQTVQENICGEDAALFDHDRYEKVVTICQLRSDMEQLPHGDQTEIGERGFNLSGGQKARIAIARAIYSRCEILVFDDVLAALDKGVSTAILNDVLKPETRTRIIVSMNMSVAEAADLTVFIAHGKALPAAPFHELMASSEAFSDFVRNSGGVSKTSECTPSVTSASVELIERTKLVEKEKIAHGSVAWSTYKAYVTASRGRCFIFLLACLFLLVEGCYVSVDIWVAQWSDDKLGIGVEDPLYLYVYASISCGYLVSMFVRSIFWVIFGHRASRVLHRRLMQGVLRSPLHFFESTPSGRILSRASKDIGDVDIMLSDRWFFCIVTAMRVLSILITISVSTPIFILVILPFLIVYYWMLNYYRCSSRDLQRLFNTSHSPLFSSYTEAVQGLTTIRAFRSEAKIIHQFQEHLNRNVRAFYTFRLVELWFIQRVSMLGAFIVLLAALGVAGFYEMIKPGMIGLALAFSLNLVLNIAISVRNFAQLEAHMSAVERIMEYAVLPPEDDSWRTSDEKEDVAHNEIVPFRVTAGAISATDLTVFYREGLDPALRNVSLNIAGGSFVGICGRTGAGKSTFFLALLRLVPWRGTILIDGVDIQKVPLSVLRQAITSVPQDPVLFSGTLRQNIDIFGTMRDDEIVRALGESHFEVGDGGIDVDVAAGGSNWSAGEKQMICFARALLQRNKILLLDEATSSMDGATDQRIQSTLRGALKDTTRLVIAHRLATIADADQIIVVDRGVVAQNGGKEIVADMMS